MGNIPDQTVICKCLNMLDISDDEYPIYNYRVPKLTLVRAVKLLIDATLNKRTDLDDITDSLRANTALQEAIGLESISSSQLVRGLGDLPLEVLQRLFLQVNKQLQLLLQPKKGIPGIGKLRILDSTSLTLPEVAGTWAYCTKDANGVKIHTQLLVVDSNTVYPDKIICSTRGVADSEVALDLVVDDDAIHVMDRGYIVYNHYKRWSDNQIRFVARIQKRNKTTISCERKVDEATGVQRDADVIITYKGDEGRTNEISLRLVEFSDEKNRNYRVLTNVWDLTAEQICEIYRHRWMIELFFKWIKQHLSFVHLYSNHPEAVWNQIYLALIAYGLTLLVHNESKTTWTVWKMLKLMRKYMDQLWETFISELHRQPTRTSKGRRRKKKLGRPRKHPIKRTTVKLILKQH